MIEAENGVFNHSNFGHFSQRPLTCITNYFSPSNLFFGALFSLCLAGWYFYVFIIRLHYNHNHGAPTTALGAYS